MIRLASLLTLALALAIAAQGVTQEKKQKGMLPQGWKALMLSPAQVQDIYKIQGEYKQKALDLEKQITMLKVEERSAMVKILTKEQRELLQKLTVGDVKKEEPPKDK